MVATPADIAKYTRDGVLLSTDYTEGQAIKAIDATARDTGTSEIEMFFDDADHGQQMLEEKFGYLSQIGALHEGVEVDTSLGLGTAIPLAPLIPCFRIVDETRGIDLTMRCQGYAIEMGSDRYAVEVRQ